MGVPASDLKTQITAARLNGGQRWACVAAPIGADGNWSDALEKAQHSGYSVEAVVITKPVATAAELSAMHDAAIALNNTYGRRLFIMAAVAGITVQQTWAQYVSEQRRWWPGWQRRASFRYRNCTAMTWACSPVAWRMRL